MRANILKMLSILVLSGSVSAFGADSPPAESSVTLAATTDAQPHYTYATNGLIDNIAGPFGSTWKLLLNASNLGGAELEAAELTMHAGTTVAAHTHKSVEILYVISGIYEHEVNGKRYRLTAGMVGIVRPGDKVRHIVPSDGDARVLVIWAPGGEAGRLSQAKGSKPDLLLPIP
jgi:quercetin dioxygenase-like cupin family protein